MKNELKKEVEVKPRVKVDLIGFSRGIVTVVEYDSLGKYGHRWKCLCKCGTILFIHAKRLTKKDSDVTSCGCLRSTKGEKSFRWKGYKEITGNKWGEIKRNAKTRNLEFSISMEYVWNIFISQKRKCALSGVDLKFESFNKAKDGNASLDRIDSSKGYIKGNVQWVHKVVNYMKMNLNQKEFLEFCAKIASFTQTTK